MSRTGKDEVRTVLFGGNSHWNETDWTDSDDRVRGGKSQSHLLVESNHAIFYGLLDTQTLGGAGFASQRTTGNDRHWDLSTYDGLELIVVRPKKDKKKYTFILKDKVLPKDPDTGREQSTISWEFDFVPSKVAEDDDDHDDDSSDHITIRIPWDHFKPTYRGKEKKDAKPLQRDNIKRMSIMMRSFFATQEGKFSLEIVSIAAVAPAQDPKTEKLKRSSLEEDTESVDSFAKDTNATQRRGIWSWFVNPCCKM